MSWILCKILKEYYIFNSTIQHVLPNKLPSAMFPMQIRVSNNPSSLNTIIPVRWPVNQETSIKHKLNVSHDKKYTYQTKLCCNYIYEFICANLQRNFFRLNQMWSSQLKHLLL